MGRKQEGDVRNQSYQSLGLFGSSAPLLSEATRTELMTSSDLTVGGSIVGVSLGTSFHLHYHYIIHYNINRIFSLWCNSHEAYFFYPLGTITIPSPQALSMNLPTGFPSEYRVLTQEGKETAPKVSLRVPVPVSCSGPVFAWVIRI